MCRYKKETKLQYSDETTQSKASAMHGGGTVLLWQKPGWDSDLHMWWLGVYSDTKPASSFVLGVWNGEERLILCRVAVFATEAVKKPLWKMDFETP